MDTVPIPGRAVVLPRDRSPDPRYMSLDYSAEFIPPKIRAGGMLIDDNAERYQPHQSKAPNSPTAALGPGTHAQVGGWVELIAPFNPLPITYKVTNQLQIVFSWVGSACKTRRIMMTIINELNSDIRVKDGPGAISASVTEGKRVLRP